MMNKLTPISMTLLLISAPIGESLAAAPILSVDIPVEARLLLIRQSSKDNQNLKLEDYIGYQDGRDKAYEESNGDCGNVNIGNIEQNRRIGSVPRTVNVIVTGPVFNTVDDC